MTAAHNARKTDIDSPSEKPPEVIAGIARMKFYNAVIGTE